MAKIVTDTTDFCAISRGHEIHVGDRRYQVTGNVYEVRFGMEEPKFWVKRAIDLDTNEKKIVKLTFEETFETVLGDHTVTWFRNSFKEAEMIEIGHEHDNLMQGNIYKDDVGNMIRVIDVIHGEDFLQYIFNCTMDYETYRQTLLPDVLKELAKAFEAIHFLHEKGYYHGDVRNDHLIKDDETGELIWIDFDYDFLELASNLYKPDIFALGNLLGNAVGKGCHSHYDIKTNQKKYGDLIDRIGPEDFSASCPARFLNLQKLYPGIPDALNDLLMRFTGEEQGCYTSAAELARDLGAFLGE